MLDLLPAILPILLVDVLNPVLFAMLVFAAGSRRPVLNSAAMLAGHTLAYFVAGIGVALGIETAAERLANPEPVDFAVSGIVGVGLLGMVLPAKKSGAPTRDEPEWELTPLKCLGFGAIVNFVGIPFALPYFAVVDQIMKAALSLSASLAALGIYNVVYALPFAVVPLAVAVAGEGAKPMLGKINAFLVRAADVLMPWMFGLLGLALVADSAAFFTRGTGLWEL
jgi:cytochrome c biogenesis protein CcdA